LNAAPLIDAVAQGRTVDDIFFFVCQKLMNQDPSIFTADLNLSWPGLIGINGSRKATSSSPLATARDWLAGTRISPSGVDPEDFE
jgi:hypothetical protein